MAIKAALLLRILPQYHAWANALLSKHKANFQSIASAGFSRLPQFLSRKPSSPPALLSSMSLPQIPWASWGLPTTPQGLDVRLKSVTMGQTYFLLREVAYDESLHCRELVHVVQQQRMLGPDLFPVLFRPGGDQEGLPRLHAGKKWPAISSPSLTSKSRRFLVNATSP